MRALPVSLETALWRVRAAERLCSRGQQVAAELAANPNSTKWEIRTFCNVFILNNKEKSKKSFSQERNFPENVDLEASK